MREGLGLAPYPFGIRGPEPGQEYKYVRMPAQANVLSVCPSSGI